MRDEQLDYDQFLKLIMMLWEKETMFKLMHFVPLTKVFNLF